MATAFTWISTGVSHPRRVAAAWLAGIGIYLVCVWIADDATEHWVNNIAWTIASIGAAWQCLSTARRLGDASARGWWLLGAGCTSWAIGQCFWNYKQLIAGVDLPFLGVGQIFYSLFPLLTIAAISQLPERHEGAPFMPKQLGNVALVLCCLAMIVILGLIEPAISSNLSQEMVWLGSIQAITIAATFLYALYTLWTYRWTRTWAVMLKLVAGTGLYAISSLIYMRAIVLQTYQPSDFINSSWLVLFGLLAWAAADRAWLNNHPSPSPSRRLLRRERWLEAVVPALLIISMIAVAVASADTLTPRALKWTAGLFVLFAIILGVREAMIQSDAQRLNNELMDANRRLNEANAGLRDSELRYRDLTTELEKRVAERTAQLQRAYGELEGFSYAVAHDLKAPLRAIDGFAHLLHDELGTDINPQAQSHLKRIRGGAQRMSSLIDDLLSYANIERRELHATHFGVRPLIEAVIDEHADDIERRNVEVITVIEPLTLFVDADGLTLVLRNLLGNAIKYSTSAAVPTIEVRLANTDDGALVTVRDNGIGFDMQYHDRIFNVFQRLHREEQYPGTGIGLALVRKAVERMGGRVWAQSSPGQGATFFVSLPKSVVVPQ